MKEKEAKSRSETQRVCEIYIDKEEKQKTERKKVEPLNYEAIS